MDRRTFLTLLLGATSVAACGGGGSGTSDLVLVPNDWEFFTGRSRVAFFLASNKQNGAPLPLTHPVALRVNQTPVPVVVHRDGPEPVYALGSFDFPTPGTYQLEATYQGHTVSLPIPVVDPSASHVPVVGKPLPSVPTPTTANPLGVNPVCTANPPCPFHTVSLDAALAAHRPVALLFATPALCQSRFCGPVLGNLQAVSASWQDRVTFIHCEIYTDLTGATQTKPVLAYGLEHEPMLYLAGADGVIRARVDNLFDRGEAAAVLQATFGTS